MNPETENRRKVQCWIFAPSATAQTQCLLLKTNAKRGAFWQPVTGGVDAGESFHDAACREVFEETGFDAAASAVDTQYEFEFTSNFGPARERVFAFRLNRVAPPQIDPSEHQDFRWVAPNDAIALLRFESNHEGLIRSYRLLFNQELRKDQP